MLPRLRASRRPAAGRREASPACRLLVLAALVVAGCRSAGPGPGPGGPAAPLAGPLRLLHPPAAAGLAQGLAAEWQARWPELEVVTQAADDPLAALAEGAGDLALTAAAPGSAPEPEAVVAAWVYPLVPGDYLAPESLTGVAGPPGEEPSGARPRENQAPGTLAPLSFRDLDWGRVLLPVAGVLPTPENIASGRYPGSRPFWLVPGPRSRGWSGPVALGELLAWTGEEERVLTRSGLADPGGRPSRPVTLAAVGDVMLARGVGRRIREEGPAYPVALVADRLAAADIALGNLESPIGVRGQPIPGKGIWFRADPAAVESLTRAGFDVLSVANNHTLDYGLENFAETLAHLEAAGIAAVGGGPDLAAARRPVIREVAGLRFAFLAYSQFADLFWSWDDPFRFAATEDRAGVAPLAEALLAEDIPRARAEADVVVVTVHWGEEYQNYPTPEQVRLARRMVDLGADLVLGHHPHAVQGFEIYRGGFIAYSMGNFIMDQEHHGPITRESMLLEFTWYPGGGRTVRVTPVWITGFRPAFLEGPEAAAALRKLAEISAAIR
ncbi:MAG: CapA family protein [Firmicutes bacterium]|nr:CapA family protein [Bacillota bacterium]